MDSDKVAEITDVCETMKTYSLGKTKTNKGLRLRHSDQERVFRLEFISNCPFSDTEFSRWVESCAFHNVTLPTLDHLTKKEKDIKDLLNYQYTNEDIDTVSLCHNPWVLPRSSIFINYIYYSTSETLKKSSRYVFLNCW